MKQPIKTPELKSCLCGTKPTIEEDWDFRDTYKVICHNCNKSLSKYCSSHHRAICLWNNRIEE